MKVPKIIKISAIILILGAGLIGSYFIVKNSAPVAGTIKGLAEKNNESPVKNPIQWVEENVLNKLGELSKIGLGDKSASDNQPEKNFTQAFSQMIFEQIKSKNEQGLTEKDGEAAISAPNENFLSQELFDKFLSQSSSNNSSGLYHPKVDEKKFKISQDISSANQIQYIKNLESISQKHLAGFNKTSSDILNEIVEKKDASSAKQLADIYKSIADDSYQIVVPTNWVDFHKAFLSHFYSSQSLWEAIADFQNDTLRTYLAAQFISDLEDSAKGLQVLLAEGMLKNNLKF